MNETKIEQSYNKFIQEHKLKFNLVQKNIAKQMDNFLKTLSCETKDNKKNNFLSYFKEKILGEKPILAEYSGLYIYGGVGRGKSMMMDLFFNNIEHNKKIRIHFHAFMQDIHARLKVERLSDNIDPIKQIASEIADSAHVICFDELQVTDITDAMVIARLFEELILRNTKFVITSNREPNTLYKDGLNRQLFVPFIKTIENKFQILQLDHDIDYRNMGTIDFAKYFTPLGSLAENHAINLWNKLTHHAIPKTTKAVIQNRELRIPKTFQNIAHIEFDFICNNNFGIADYIYISKNFNTIIFSNIPKLSSDMRNQATRFRNFIDILYEEGNIVYFIADAEAENLYIQGDYSFEFERTISRIKEISSI